MAVCLLAPELRADMIVPVRTIQAGEIIAAGDVLTKPSDSEMSGPRLAEILGQEARVALYPGRPVRAAQIGPPALVGRNDLVTLVFLQGPLRITAEGRSLARGAAGDRVRVMNLGSRSTVSGEVQPDGSVEVE